MRASGPDPDAGLVEEFDGSYQRSFEVSVFRPRGAREGWWVDPRQLEGEPGLEPDRTGAVRARVRLVGRLSPPGRYGHFGMYRFEFEVLRVEGVAPMDASPPPPDGAGHDGDEAGTALRFVTYTLRAPDLETAASMVGGALGVTMHRHDSPMIGPWYADVSGADLVRGLRGPRWRREARGPRVILTSNAVEAGSIPALEYPGGLAYVLHVLVPPGAPAWVELDLLEAGLEVRPEAGSSW